MEADLWKMLVPSGTPAVPPSIAGASTRAAGRLSQIGAASPLASVAVTRAASSRDASCTSRAMRPLHVTVQRSISPSIQRVSISSAIARRASPRSMIAWARRPGKRQVIS